jgi:hypothetical protein
MRILLLVESFDIRPSSQYVLVVAIPSCFRPVNICLRQVNLSRCNPRHFRASPSGNCTLFNGRAGGVEERLSSYAECDMSRLPYYRKEGGYRTEYHFRHDNTHLGTYGLDRRCGLVARVSGYRPRGSGFDSRRYQVFLEVVVLEHVTLSLMRIIE